jgi:hypothetical protein
MSQDWAGMPCCAPGDGLTPERLGRNGGQWQARCSRSYQQFNLSSTHRDCFASMTDVWMPKKEKFVIF